MSGALCSRSGAWMNRPGIAIITLRLEAAHAVWDAATDKRLAARG